VFPVVREVMYSDMLKHGNEWYAVGKGELKETRMVVKTKRQQNGMKIL
jgi:hypothetical protein